MYLDHYKAHLLAKEKIEDSLREAEHARQIKAAKEGRQKARRWRWSRVALKRNELPNLDIQRESL